MPLEPKQPTAEREQTDESLRVEREKADDALGKLPSAIDETADAVISKARARADAVLAAARAKTDRRAANPSTVVQSPKSVAAERSLEDRVLRAERSEADDALTAERAEHAAMLTTERAETDIDDDPSRDKTAQMTEGRQSWQARDVEQRLVGLIAVRELDADREDDSGPLARKLFVLDTFFAEWPTDEQATSATDADFWRRFGL
jgi:hypothetical protein